MFGEYRHIGVSWWHRRRRLVRCECGHVVMRVGTAWSKAVVRRAGSVPSELTMRPVIVLFLLLLLTLMLTQ